MLFVTPFAQDENFGAEFETPSASLAAIASAFYQSSEFPSLTNPDGVLALPPCPCIEGDAYKIVY